MERLERLYAGQPPAVETLEQAFRHSGWQRDRERVATALAACNVPPARLERFAACGGGCVVEFSPTAGRHRLKAFYCGDRFCVPCMKAASRRAVEKFKHFAAGRPAWHVVLTRRHDQASLSDALTHLQASFKTLRLSKFWRHHVAGGVAVCEIKRGKGTGLWHVHLHCLTVGTEMDRFLLSNEWEKATRSSFNVKVIPVEDEERGFGYVAKYATKGFDRSVLAVHSDLCECLLALRGRRMFCTFGDWYNAEDRPERPVVRDWRAVDRLSRVAVAAAAGEQWAVGILTSLRVDLRRLQVEVLALAPAGADG